ncbi:hypothetical protein GIB67_005853 [Kingdonia uniflora]|uniref:non-specific serine/threonine protein kinase n=1 Tax=Kingdonia uniflora TaxID=39325 RepID=A0A7J7LU92_9MAGN|nr:hypothetical protein GIB67_005853 [Kingdonia uniflora]
MTLDLNLPQKFQWRPYLSFSALISVNLEVVLTPTHLAIVMEYAADGELFKRIVNDGRFSEDAQIFHRDLKLENTLLDGSTAPRLKICDFGYSKSYVSHSQPKSTVETPTYIVPEVLSKKEYDGKVADVWSCRVTLYVMLVGAYPFENPEDPRNFRKMIGVICFRNFLSCAPLLSFEFELCTFLVYQYVYLVSTTRFQTMCEYQWNVGSFSQIFVANLEKRLTMLEIKNHPWFLKNLPIDLMDDVDDNFQSKDISNLSQSIEDIFTIVREAGKLVEGDTFGENIIRGNMDLDDLDDDVDLDDVEASGDFVCTL